MVLVRVRLGFHGCSAVECVGRSEGVVMLWKDEVKLVFQSFSLNHVDVHVQLDEGDPWWRVTGFYGHPDHGNRRTSWNLLRMFVGVSSLLWVVVEEFNDLLEESDKQGRVSHPRWML